MPAAAVIPAPVAYIKVVAVKKLVVGFLTDLVRSGALRVLCTVERLSSFQRVVPTVSYGRAPRFGSFTLKKLECSKQAYALNTLAWNNNIGLLFYFVGLLEPK